MRVIWLNFTNCQRTRGLVFALVLLVLEAGVDCETHVYIKSKEVKWNEARRECMKDGDTCDLAALNSISKELLDSLGTKVNTKYWIGIRKVDILQWSDGSPFFIDDGCYITPDNFTKWTSSVMPKLEGCFVKCKTPFVAMQDTKCYCVDSPEKDLLQKRPQRECTKYCQETGYCGGHSRHISLYRIGISNRILMDLDKISTSSNFFASNAQRKVLISNRQVTSLSLVCISESGNYSLIANTSCPPGSQSIVLNNTNLHDVFDKLSDVQSSAGVNLSSLAYSTQRRWLNGTLSDMNKGTCFTISGFNNSKEFLNSCSNRMHPIICMCYNETYWQNTTVSLTSTDISASHEEHSYRMMPTTVSLTPTDISVSHEEHSYRMMPTTSIRLHSEHETASPAGQEKNRTPSILNKNSTTNSRVQPSQEGASITELGIIVGTSAGAFGVIGVVVFVILVVTRQLRNKKPLDNHQAGKKHTAYPAL